MGSSNLISQKRGCVIACHFNNVLYCLQALVVPGVSNGGFKWDRERRDGADAGQIDHLIFVLSDFVAVFLSCCQSRATSPEGHKAKRGLLAETAGSCLRVARETD